MGRGATFIGQPCKYGHGRLRYVSFKHCVECIRLRSQRRYEKDPVKIAAFAKNWRGNHRGRVREINREQYRRRVAAKAPAWTLPIVSRGAGQIRIHLENQNAHTRTHVCADFPSE